MKFNVNIEVSDDEIKRYGQELFLKGLGAVMSSIGGAFEDPGAMAAFQQGIVTMLQHGVQIGVRQRQQHRHPFATGPYPMGATGPYPPGYPGYGPSPGTQAYAPGPYGPQGPGPYTGPPMPGANGPAGSSNVRPIQSEGAQVERCYRIESNEKQEEGVICCHCATVNAVYRETCRRCNHRLCAVGVVTPAPQHPPPPQVGSPEPPPEPGAPR